MKTPYQITKAMFAFCRSQGALSQEAQSTMGEYFRRTDKMKNAPRKRKTKSKKSVI